MGHFKAVGKHTNAAFYSILVSSCWRSTYQTYTSGFKWPTQQRNINSNPCSASFVLLLCFCEFKTFCRDYPGPEPGLSVGLSQHPQHLWSAGEQVEGAVLCTQGYTISKTQGMSRKSPSEGTVSIVCLDLRPWTKPMILCDECLHIKMYG